MTTASASTNDNVHNFGENMKSAQAEGVHTAQSTAATEDKKMTAWGATWRIGGVLLGFVAVVIAVVLGMQYAAAYIAALGLSALATTVATVAANAVGYIVSGVIAWKVGNFMTSVIEKFTADKAQA